MYYLSVSYLQSNTTFMDYFSSYLYCFPYYYMLKCNIDVLSLSIRIGFFFGGVFYNVQIQHLFTITLSRCIVNFFIHSNTTYQKHPQLPLERISAWSDVLDPLF